MEGSKLIYLMQSLSQEETKALGNYLVKSNYDKAGSVFKLYNYLKKCYPDFPEKKINKALVFKKIMPKDKAFNDKVLRNIMSKLSQGIEDFLLEKELKENEVERDFLMLSILKKRKQDKLFFQKFDRLQRKWKKNPTPGIEHYHNEFKLLKEYYNHPYSTLEKNKEVDMMDVLQKLDEYYCAFKLYYGVGLIQNQSVINEAKDERINILVKEILQSINLNYLAENIHVNIFAHLFNAYTNKVYDDYETIKSLYFKQIDQYNAAEKHDLFLLLQSYCYENYRQGKQKFLVEVFELNKFAVEQGFLYKNKSISHDVFRNIVQLGCTVGEFAWTKQFIQEYKAYLDKEKKEDVVALCEAALYFYQGNYEQTLDKLLVVKYQDPVYAVHVRFLQLQSYYELEEYEDLFYNLVNSFTVYLSRNRQLPDSIKQASLNFIQYTKKLYELPYKLDKEIKKVLEDLETNSLVANKKWLLQKAEEIKVKNKI